MKILLWVVLIVLTGGAVMAVDEPAYEVVRTYDDFELRRYSPYLVAETEVEGDFSDAGNLAFRILFRYISGENRSARSIAMTAPVTQAPTDEGEKIAMTAPVTQAPVSGTGAGAGTGTAAGTGRHVVGFVMPASFTLETLPKPNDARVRVREVPARLVAALRYSGSWNEGRYREREKALLGAVAREGFKPLGAPVFARYNSPFAVWFMRRNEVLLDVVETPRR